MAEEFIEHLPPDDEEYLMAKNYLLACLANKGELGRVDVWKITNQQLSLAFERKAKSLLKIVSLTCLNTDKVGFENRNERDIFSRGFEIRENGMEFATGVLASIPAANPASLVPEEYKLIYSEVAIGRSVIVEEKSVMSHPMPRDFHSFYIPQKPLDRNNDGVFDYDEFQAAAYFDDRDPIGYYHRYYIKDPAQVLPKYMIVFSFAHKTIPASGENGGMYSSSTAGLSILSKAKSVLGGSSNSDDQIGYFDPVLFKPVTFGEYRRSRGRQLQTIDEAYEQAKADLKKPDVLVKGRRDWLEQQLSELDDRLRQINLNMAEVKEQIESASSRCQAELSQKSRQKFEALLGVEIELNRQKEQLAWMDEVMKLAKAKAETKLEKKDNSAEAQVEFLRAWKCHTVMRNAVTRMKAQELNVLKKVVPDMALKSGNDLEVIINPYYNPSGDDGENPAAGGGGGNTAPSELWKSLNKGVSQGHFSVPARPKHDLLVPSLQAIIDMESERIQQALEAAKKDVGMALPPSVLRSPAAGDRYTAPLSPILTGHSFSVKHAANADPKQKFTDVMQTYVGSLTDRTRAIDLSFQPSGLMQDTAPTTSTAGGVVGRSSPETVTQDQVPATPFVSPTPKKLVAGRVLEKQVAFPPTAQGFTGKVATLPVEALEKLAARFSSQSLAKFMALKKQRMESNKTAQQDFATGAKTLAVSAILQECGRPDAVDNIYFSLPATKKPPTLKRIYSTREDPRALNVLVDKCVAVSGSALP